jgi:hypothetical protein
LEFSQATVQRFLRACLKSIRQQAV